MGIISSLVSQPKNIIHGSDDRRKAKFPKCVQYVRYKVSIASMAQTRMTPNVGDPRNAYKLLIDIFHFIVPKKH